MTTPSRDEVRAVLAERLTHGSLAHCEAVAATARELALRYGVDPDAAEIAGMLHDWSRDASDEDLLSAAERYGLSVNAVEYARPYLLHARVASVELGERFDGIPEGVLAAVEGHTLGPGDEDPLARIVYIADMIEPARRWDGVEVLRKAVGKVDLEELYTRACQHTMEQLVRNRRRIHPRALETWNSLVGVSRP